MRDPEMRLHVGKRDRLGRRFDGSKKRHASIFMFEERVRSRPPTPGRDRDGRRFPETATRKPFPMPAD
jgi:hypothetical protein